MRFCAKNTKHGKKTNLGLLVTTKLKVFASLERQLVLVLADRTLEPEHNLFGRLGLFVEDGLGLTTESRLLSVVPTFSCIA